MYIEIVTQYIKNIYYLIFPRLITFGNGQGQLATSIGNTTGYPATNTRGLYFRTELHLLNKTRFEH